jgi:NAD(P)H-hydrate repair Nnr-like enzyme with NAD(P)H-hydrate dehydratase domain
MGDVLSGVAAAFLARKITALDAASAAAWLCGKTAQIITSPGHPSGLTDESLTASDIIQHLGLAFQSLP